MVYEDSKGSLWYADKGLFRMHERDGQIQFEGVPLNLPADPTRSLNIGRVADWPDGSLWLMSSTGLLRLLPDGRTVIYRQQTSFRQAPVNMVAQSNGVMWLAWGRNVYVMRPEAIDSLPAVRSVLRATASK